MPRKTQTSLLLTTLLLCLVGLMIAVPGMQAGANQGAAGVAQLSMVTTSTPEPDGAVIHIVRAGENISTIAEAYGLSYGELLAINGFDQNIVIFPGDRLVIRLGFTPTPTSEFTLTPTPTRTLRPTIQPTSTPTRAPTQTRTPVAPTQAPTATPEPSFLDKYAPAGDPLLLGIAVIGGLGVLLMLLGLLLKSTER